MNIDAYSPCPCHLEKKIKFCCGKEIATDLNQIASLSSAGQELAALDEIERAIARQGTKECLLTLKTRLLLARGDNRAAEENNELLLQHFPQNVTGYYHRALIQLSRREIEQAVHSLQDALDLNQSGEIPLSIATGFRMVGIGLVSIGHLIAGRAHLFFASLLKNHTDRELVRMYSETFEIVDAPLFLRHELLLPKVSEQHLGEEWAKKYQTVCRASERGQFRKGLKYLKKIDNEFPGQHVLIRAIATLLTYLGAKPSEIQAAWKRVQEIPGISIHEQIEALAISEYFSSVPAEQPSSSDTENRLELIKIEIPIDRFQEFTEKCFSTPHLILDEEPVEAPDDSPPPRNVFLILDQPLVPAAELTVDNMSTVCGTLMLFGRQTDREARIEVYTSRPHRDVTAKKVLENELGEFLLSPPTETLIESQSIGPLPQLQIDFYSPEGIDQKRYVKIIGEKIQRNLAVWADTPNPHFNGQTPCQAAQNSSNHATLEWILSEVEHNPALMHCEQETIIQFLRAKLGLPDLPPVSLGDSEPTVLTPTQIFNLDLSNSSDQQLQLMLQIACVRAMTPAIRKLCKELVNRPESLHNSRVENYLLLGKATVNFDVGIECFAKARAACREMNQPVGRVLVEELEYRIRNGRTENVRELFENITLHHMQEPHVQPLMERLVSRLSSFSDKVPGNSSVSDASAGSTSDGTQLSATSLVESTASDSPNPVSKLWIPE